MAPRGGLLGASMSFRWARADEVIDSLQAGLESRITFTTRLYETRRPAFSFAGDRLLFERSVTRSAFWDFLDQVFVVEQEGVPQKTYTDPRELIRGFFALRRGLQRRHGFRACAATCMSRRAPSSSRSA